MIVSHINDTPGKAMDMPGAEGAAMKVLVGPPEGWADYVMRVIELDQNGCSPRHDHPWPHINYMLEGQGELEISGHAHSVHAGSFAFVPTGAVHQFRNVGSGMFRFICIVPKEGHK